MSSSKERFILSQIIRDWAQNHDTSIGINAAEVGDQGVENTAQFFTWFIKSSNVQIDLLTLLDRLDLYITNLKDPKYPDGMYCRDCQTWNQFSGPNQEDGTFLCYYCRNRPY